MSGHILQNSRTYTCKSCAFRYMYILPQQKWLKAARGTSLVVQWLRILLPMQWARFPSLVREDPICCGATKPVHHSYGSLRAPGAVLHNKRSHHKEKPNTTVKSSPTRCNSGKPPRSSEPSTAKESEIKVMDPLRSQPSSHGHLQIIFPS